MLYISPSAWVSSMITWVNVPCQKPAASLFEMQEDELAPFLFFPSSPLGTNLLYLFSNFLPILYIYLFLIMGPTMPIPPKPVAFPSGYASNFDKAERASSVVEPSTTQSSLKSSTFSTTYTEKPLLSRSNTQCRHLDTSLWAYLTNWQQLYHSKQTHSSHIYSMSFGFFSCHGGSLLGM